jgi:two-component system sensor histidine kinase VicK
MREKSVTRAQANTKTHQIEISPSEPALPVKADPDKMLQVLDNLLDNAIKYSPEGGLVTVTGQKKDGEVQVSVTDQGIGIPQEKQGMLFEKFYRVDSPLKSQVSGTGLGLNLCQHIVKAHGGRIWVDSEEGKGSTLSFAVPV